MSVLEIVLYSIIGVGFVIWLTIEIVNFKKGKNQKKKENQEEKDDLE